MQTMRLGLVGCGGIGALRAAAISRVGSCRLAALSDLDLGRARDLAARYGGAVESDWRALTRRDDVDAVLVCSPPHLHAEMGITALEAGKHVLCEKPLARSPEESREMVQAARTSGRFLATGFNYRFYPSMRKARELLDAGAIGELDHIRSYAGYSATDHHPAWVHDVEVMGGGALRDNGIHLLDLTRWFLGEVAEVKGFGTNHVWRFPGCEDNGFALLRNAAGNVASLHATWNEWRGYRLLVELYGTRGCIRAWCFPMRTELVRTQGLGGKRRRSVHRFPWTFVQEHLRSYRWVVVQSFIRELEAFARAARGEPTSIAVGEDGSRAVEIAFQAAQASDAAPGVEPMLVPATL